MRKPGGDFSAAEEKLAEFLPLLKADTKVPATDRREVLFQLATARVRQGKLAAAENICQEWLALTDDRDRSYEAHAMRAFQGARFLELASIAAAEAKLRPAFAGMEGFSTQRSAGERWAEKFYLEQLVKLYEAKQDAEQAERWRKQLQNFPSDR